MSTDQIMRATSSLSISHPVGGDLMFTKDESVAEAAAPPGPAKWSGRLLAVVRLKLLLDDIHVLLRAVAKTAADQEFASDRRTSPRRASAFERLI